MQCKGTRFPGFALVLPAKFAMYAISSLQKTSDERVTRLEQIPRLDSLANTRSGRQGKREKKTGSPDKRRIQFHNPLLRYPVEVIRPDVQFRRRLPFHAEWLDSFHLDGKITN